MAHINPEHPVDFTRFEFDLVKEKAGRLVALPYKVVDKDRTEIETASEKRKPPRKGRQGGQSSIPTITEVALTTA